MRGLTVDMRDLPSLLPLKASPVLSCSLLYLPTCADRFFPENSPGKFTCKMMK
jgi:hypothetical protein